MTVSVVPCSTCQGGKFSCTNKKCEARCSATGDPHYLTFDGHRYDFMGTCSYYLLYDNDFDIIVDNIQCGHSEYATCTRSVTIDYNGMNIKLDHNNRLFVNGREITEIPYEVPGLKVFMVSSLFMEVLIPFFPPPYSCRTSFFSFWFGISFIVRSKSKSRPPIRSLLSSPARS